MSDKDFVLKKLAEAEKLELGNFYFGIKSRNAPAGATFQHAARFNFILSGKKRQKLPLKGIETDLELLTGDVQVSERNSWELITTYVSPCEILCIIPRNEYLRISYYEAHLEKGIQVINNTFYHTNHYYSEALHHTANALCSCANGINIDLIRQLAKVLIKLAIEECKSSCDEDKGRGEAIFQKIKRWLENNFTEDISREAVAKIFNVTPAHVSRLFKQKTGKTFIDYLTMQRIEFAKMLLLESDMTVYQVAEECGYNNYIYFVRRFREICGMPPGTYKNTHSA